MHAAEAEVGRAGRRVERAAALLACGFGEVAAKEACLAALGAGRGYVLAVTGRWCRSGRAVVGAFGRAGSVDPAISRKLLTMLPQAYEAACMAEDGGAAAIDAGAVLESARRFVVGVGAAVARFTVLDPAALGQVLQQCWSGDSSGQWTEREPARGQCNVTALVAEEVLGGEVLRTMAPGGWHYYNRVAGTRLDFTASQFTGAVRYDDQVALRRDALDGTSEAQYQAFRDAVVRRVTQR